MQIAEPTELLDLRMSEEARPLYDRVVRFLEDVVAPMQEEFFRLGEGRADPWSYAPGQLEALDAAKAQAKEAGLWNFFLPNSEVGGLTNLDYAYIAVELGRRRRAGAGGRSRCPGRPASARRPEPVRQPGAPPLSRSRRRPRRSGGPPGPGRATRVSPRGDLEALLARAQRAASGQIAARRPGWLALHGPLTTLYVPLELLQ